MISVAAPRSLRFAPLALLLAAASLTSAGCHPASTAKGAATPPPAGSAQARPGAEGASADGRPTIVRFALGVFHQQAPTPEALATFTKTLTAAGFVIDQKLAENRPSGPTIAVFHPSIAEFPPPPLAILAHAGDAVSDADKRAAQTATAVTLIGFAAPTNRAFASASTLYAAIAAFERAAPGIVWDEESRLVFRAPALEAEGKDWATPVPDIRKHINMHAYRSGEHLRLVTVGMAKLGLPDLVVEGLSVDDAEGMSEVLVLVGQTLLERGSARPNERLELDGNKLRNPAARAAFTARAVEGATSASVELASAKPERGDADNALLTIVFPPEANKLHERHAELIGQLFGRSGEIHAVATDDAELQAARARARKKLMALKPAFVRGLPETEHLSVKSPFPTSTGSVEWMWVEVTRWQGTQIDGILRNEPFNVPTLKRGSIVQIDEGTVSDYLYQKADGTREGNETEAAVKRGKTVRK